MTLRTLEPAQRIAARVAGLLYLLTTITGVFGLFYVRSVVAVSGDFARTASNIVAHAQLFRIGIVFDLLTVAGCVVLNLALYELLAPVDRRLARLAALFRLVEQAIYGTITVFSVVVLSVLTGPDYARAFEPGQLQALARIFVGAKSSGFLVSILFLCVGSTAYMVLLFRSGYIPKVIALLGMIIGPLGGLYFLAQILSPAWVSTITAAFRALPPVVLVVLAILFLPLLAFEVILGLWLLVKGVAVPQQSGKSHELNPATG